MKYLSTISLLLGVCFATRETPISRRLDEEEPWLTACANATTELQKSLVNATADFQRGIESKYNLTWVEEECYTPHFTSSCSLDFDTLPEEAAWRAACTQAGGKVHEINEKRFRCREGTTDYVRLLNFVGHSECVASVCEDEELAENHDELVKDDAAFFGTLFNEADCELENDYVPHGGAMAFGYKAAVFLSGLAATWMMVLA